MSEQAIDHFREHFASLPLIAILRGITPDEVVAVGRGLFDVGFRVIEIPLNSPEPLESLARLAAELGRDATIGCGTVLTPGQVAAVAAAGGRIVVSPNADADVIKATLSAGLVSAPGVATPGEGFAAVAAGANLLKLFPAEQLPPRVIKSWRAVFPNTLPLVPVGGISPESLSGYLAAGADGFGLGSALYAAGRDPRETARRGEAFVEAWRSVRQTTRSG